MTEYDDLDMGEEMQPSFDLADLFREDRPTVRTLSGDEVPIRYTDDFSPEDLGRLQKLQKLIRGNLKRIENSNDPAAAGRLERAASEFLRLVIPDLPQEDLDKMQIGQKIRLQIWWNNQQALTQEMGAFGPDGDEG